MTTFVRHALTTLRNSKGVTAAEYAILAAGICLVVAGAATAFKTPLENKMKAIFDTPAATASAGG